MRMSSSTHLLGNSRAYTVGSSLAPVYNVTVHTATSESIRVSCVQRFCFSWGEMAEGKDVKIALWVFLVAAFVGWVLSLIGLAGLQSSCYDVNAGSPLFSLTGIRGFNNVLRCEEVLRYYWFMLAFEIITLIALACMTAFGLLAASALCWLAWLTVLSVLYIQGSDSFLALQHISTASDRLSSFSQLAAAGWCIISIANLGLIFLLGWRSRKLRGAVGPSMKY